MAFLARPTATLSPVLNDLIAYKEAQTPSGIAPLIDSIIAYIESDKVDETAQKAIQLFQQLLKSSESLNLIAEQFPPLLNRMWEAHRDGTRTLFSKKITNLIKQAA